MQNKDFYKYFKASVLKEICSMFFSGNLKQINRLPYNILPKGQSPKVRCCEYKERAILGLRALAAVGYSVNEVDEAEPLSAYINDAPAAPKHTGKLLTVLSSACAACVKSRYSVSEVCQGCLSKKCKASCPFGAIEVKNRKAVINQDKCKSCGKCMASCPYGAIVKLRVPCEEACPVGAIKKDDKGLAVIDHSRCISCGKCLSACPFGAVMERGQILDVLKALSSGRCAALLTPASHAQFDSTAAQFSSALKALGFAEVYPTETGAEITLQYQTQEFKEKVMEEGGKFLMSSCCPAYSRLVKKHIPELLPNLSAAANPVHYTAQIAKNERKDIINVFIGPCLAKRKEAQEDQFIDYSITFEELAAMFEAKNIIPKVMAEDKSAPETWAQSLGFALPCGVCNALQELGGDVLFIKPHSIEGIDKTSLFKLKAYVKGKPDFNMLEARACHGACTGGCGTVKESSACAQNIAAEMQELKHKNKYL